METDYDPIRDGYQQGFARAREEFELEYVPEEVAGFDRMIYQAIEVWPEDLSDRFQRTFAELTAIAQASRYQYEEPSLDAEDILSYLAFSALFLNSWRHF